MLVLKYLKKKVK